MSYSFPQDLAELARQEMLAGGYGSEDDLLRDALLTLAERRSDLAAIRTGIADLEAGRLRPFDEVAREIAERHQFNQQ